MELNKEKTTKQIFSMIETRIKDCTKISLANIVMPRWSDIGLWGKVMAMHVKTKEQPEGCPYSEISCRVVVRIIDGKLYMTGGRPDAYAWDKETVKKYLSNPDKVKYIGINSPAGLVNLAEIIMTIKSEKERLDLADYFSMVNRDFLLVYSPEEKRRCVEVTQELYDAGLTACVDDWMEPDDNGNAKATQLNVGDFLIVKSSGVYCVRREEFMGTYKILA